MSSVQLASPYREGLRWFKGNLHTHTTRSDGAREPEEVVRDYQARGYDFLAITDHDILVEPEPYQHNTTMTLIPGVEVTANGPHLLHINTSERVPPHRDRQDVLDEIAEQKNSFAVLNHPNWLAPLPGLHYTHSNMRELSRYAGIEIYNGVIERLPGTALATDQWDQLLSNDMRLWGYGHDDSHLAGDVELAWNMVQAPESSASELVDSLREGRFYVSTGIYIQSIAVSERTIRVITSNATRIRFISRWGVIQDTLDSQAAEFTVPEDPDEASILGYIRVECYGGGSAMAWSQPLWIETGN
ncbi:MAG: CehA/McbA family metallohydrolase [Candidatus Latescibacteria bacterium]|nr:CehA/McbA family metallohydrolase [Candidatus Latescibacterota bacterium]